MNLRDYEQDKFAIADILRSASKIGPPESYEWQERLRNLFARLAEDQFNLVVVGRFSRGKSSLMNAIVGSNRLPVGIIPLTSVITTVSYGTKEQVVLKYNERILDQEVPIDALPQYVTQQGNPGNVRGIKMAEVQLRAEILRRGFYFVDTPGLGSAIIENTRTTESFLPEADAFLVVTSYESPLSEEEIRFFRATSSSARRIFVVLNKQDTVSSEDRNDVVTYVRDQLRAIFVENEPKIFSVSAHEGLEAKRSRDTARLIASGVPALEEELVRFLLTEKRTEFLLRMSDRVVGLLQDMPRSGAAINLAAQIGAFAARLARDQRSMGYQSAPAAGTATELPSLRQFGPCEVCAHIHEALWDFLCKYQYQLIVNHEEQRRFAEHGGLCSFHTWQYHSVASPYGICAGYPSLLDHLAKGFRAAAADPQLDAPAKEIHALLPGQERCVLCNVRSKAEFEAISNLASRFAENDARTLSSLSAICLPHVAMLSAAIQDIDMVRKLMDHHATLLERLSEDMQRFTLKHDALRRGLESGEEETAAARALLLVAGHRNVNAG